MNKASNNDSRKAWTEDEDHAIRTLVKKHGTHHWSQISKRMLDHFGAPGRTGKQCRQRWHNYLNPKINRAPWSQEEENILFSAHEKCGNKWKQISKSLPGRTDNDIKNKFYSSMRKKLRKINKNCGEKNSTSKVKQIKPKILSNILAQIQESQPHLMNFLMKYQENIEQSQFDQKQKLMGKKLIIKIKQLNQNYLNEKMGTNNMQLPMRQTRSKHSQSQKNKQSLLKSQQYLVKMQSKLSQKLSQKKQKKIKRDEAKVQKIEQQSIQNNHQNIFQDFAQEFNFEFQNDNNSYMHSTPGVITRRGSKSEQNNYFNINFSGNSPNLGMRYVSPLGLSPSPGFNGPLFQPNLSDFSTTKLDNVISNLKRRVNGK